MQLADRHEAEGGPDVHTQPLKVALDRRGLQGSGDEIQPSLGVRLDGDVGIDHRHRRLTELFDDPCECLYYLGCGRRELLLNTERNAMRALLLGGAPFGETVLMWWNFVARTTEEIVAAREDWEAGRRFGEVRAYLGPRFTAPPFVARPVPRG